MNFSTGVLLVLMACANNAAGSSVSRPVPRLPDALGLYSRSAGAHIAQRHRPHRSMHPVQAERAGADRGWRVLGRSNSLNIFCWSALQCTSNST